MVSNEGGKYIVQYDDGEEKFWTQDDLLVLSDIDLSSSLMGKVGIR